LAHSGKEFCRRAELTATTLDTESIRDITAYIQVDPTITNIDYSKGPVYLPPHLTKTGLLSHVGDRWVWQIGDLPNGYFAAVGIHIRKLRPKLHQGYVLSINWYAVTSPSEPRSSWTHLTGSYEQF